MKKNNFLLLASITALLSLASCSKGDTSNPTPASGKNVKMTIKVDGAKGSEMDFVSVVTAGADLKGSTTLWKVNGSVRNNEQSIALDDEDFEVTNTYNIESITPLSAAGLNLQFINFGTPFKISYKVIVDGAVKVEENNVSVEEDKNFSKSLSF